MQIQSNIHINPSNVSKKNKLHYVEFDDLGYKLTVVGKSHEIEILSCTEVFWNEENDTEKIHILSEQIQQQNGGYFLVNTSRFTMIPQRFFSENLLKDYLFIHKAVWDSKQYIPYCDNWNKEKLFLTYTMPNFVLSVLKNATSTQAYHRLTSLNYIAQKKKLARGKTIFVYVQKDQFILWAVDNNRILFAEEYKYTENADVAYKILSLRNFLQWDKMEINCYIVYFDKINKEFADLLLSYKFNLVIPNPERIAQKFGLSFKQKPELYNYFFLLFLATCEL